MAVTDQQIALKEQAGQVAAASRDARGWIDDARNQAQSVANEADSLLVEARRAESLARKLARSATRRMCVGVYGASQQGKSYLVSVLARPPGKSELLARFASDTRDFVREINPQGGKESTGLVTRFTTEPPSGAVDAAHPVDLLLLTETDIVKILANSFQSDFDQNNVQLPIPRGDDVRKRLAELEKKKQPRIRAAHLDEIVLSDLSEYFQKNFYNRWQDLEPVRYWMRLIELAPYLPLDARAQLLAVLWGGLDEFTAIFMLLAGALEKLEHPEEAVTEMPALIPRDSSIIDVATLEQQLGTAADDRDRLSVRPRLRDGTLGAAQPLPRAVLTALIAELRITMDERPWPMFEHTDLLDFPGARSRLKLTVLPSDADDRAKQVRQLLLRGKIAYLFQRYSEERELTAMLLCMGNKPNEVKDLGTLVRQWIELTHGATPEARRRVPAALFLVLTMMDLEFLPKAGETDDALAKKWDVRLYTSLSEPYQHDGWVQDFAGAPFDSTLMLRNPNFRQDHLVEYETAPGSEEPVQPLVEIGLSRRNRLYIDKLQHSFLASPVVAKHVAGPGRAWDAMFTFNDGGVSFIVDRLTTVSDPALKIAQVEQRLRDGTSVLHANLKRFYFGMDERARREKEAALKDIRTALQRAFQPRKFRPFPRFLSLFMVTERDLREIALTITFARGLDAPAVPDEDPVEDIFGTPSGAAALVQVPKDDRAAQFATAVLRHWIGQLRRLPQDEAVVAHFGLNARAITDIVEQMIVGADRTKLAIGVAALVRAATDMASVRWEDMADRIVTIAAQGFNAFIAELGNTGRPLAERPGVPEGVPEPQRRVFEPSPRVPAQQLPKLGKAPEPLELRNFVDWGVAFLQMGLDNLSYGGGRELSEAMNARLGGILRLLTKD